VAEAVLLAVGAPVALGWAAPRPARVLAVRAKGGDMTRVAAIVAMLLSLHPGMPRQQAQRYATIIDSEGQKQGA